MGDRKEVLVQQAQHHLGGILMIATLYVIGHTGDMREMRQLSEMNPVEPVFKMMHWPIINAAVLLKLGDF